MVEMEVGEDNTAVVKHRVAEKMMRDHCKLFGYRYSKKLPLLPCFAWFCDCMYDNAKDSEVEFNSDSDAASEVPPQFQSFQKKCLRIDRLEMRRRRKKARMSTGSFKNDCENNTKGRIDAASSPATVATTYSDDISDEEAEF